MDELCLAATPLRKSKVGARHGLHRRRGGVQEPVSFVDFAATLLSLARVPVPTRTPMLSDTSALASGGKHASAQPGPGPQLRNPTRSTNPNAQIAVRKRVLALIL
jgi:hypothetical protein